MQRTTSPASNTSSLHHVPVESEKEGHARTVAGYIQKGALSDKDVSYLAFKAVDINSISGTPSPRKNTSTNSNGYTFGASVSTANSVCTLHAVTDFEARKVTQNSVVSAKDEDTSAIISSYSDIRTLANKSETNSQFLAPSFSIPARNVIQKISQTELTTLSGANDSLLQSCDDNPFQNDRLPIWQKQDKFQAQSLNSKADSDTGSFSPPTSSAASLGYPPPHESDLRNTKQTQSYNGSSSPNNGSHIHGYYYKRLNETPTSPELLAFRQQQQVEQHGQTNCLAQHPTSNNANFSYFYDPTTTSDIQPFSGITPLRNPEVIHVLYTTYTFMFTKRGGNNILVVFRCVCPTKMLIQNKLIVIVSSSSSISNEK